MSVCVTLSANAGVSIEIGGKRIWVDALHNTRCKPFSTLSIPLQKQMLTSPAFQSPDYICYTHCHPDHYCESLTDTALNLWPNAKVLAPEGKYGCFSGEEWCLQDDTLTLRFLKLPHEGQQYRDVVHYGLIISNQDYNILLPGDCAVNSEKLAQAIANTPIQLALLDFPWLTLRNGQAFLRSHLPQSKYIFFHLPFEQDDRFGYRIAAARHITQMDNAWLLQDPLQTIVLE